MSDYSQIVDFSVKDALATGNPNKLVKGSEIDAELTAIAAAIATKVDDTDLAAFDAVETRKTADETVNNSATLQDDDHLASMSLAASSVYRVRGTLIVNIKNASDMKALVLLSSAPTSINIMHTVSGSTTGVVSSTQQVDNSTAAIILATSGDAAGVVVAVDGIIRTNGAATAKLQWAQNSAASEDLVLKSGSYLSFRKIG